LARWFIGQLRLMVDESMAARSHCGERAGLRQ
jgi:hypothetical protein